MQRSLNEHLGLAHADQLDRALAVVGGLDLPEPGDVEVEAGGDLGDPTRGPDKHWLDDPGFGRLNSGPQGVLVARVSHSRLGRRQSLAVVQ